MTIEIIRTFKALTIDTSMEQPIPNTEIPEQNIWQESPDVSVV